MILTWTYFHRRSVDLGVIGQVDIDASVRVLQILSRKWDGEQRRERMLAQTDPENVHALQASFPNCSRTCIRTVPKRHPYQPAFHILSMFLRKFNFHNFVVCKIWLKIGLIVTWGFDGEEFNESVRGLGRGWKPFLLSPTLPRSAYFPRTYLTCQYWKFRWKLMNTLSEASLTRVKWC